MEQRANREDRAERRKELRKYARYYLKMLGVEIDESILPDKPVPICIVDDEGNVIEQIGEIEPKD